MRKELIFVDNRVAIICSTEEEARRVTEISQEGGWKRKDGKEWSDNPTPAGFAYDIYNGTFASAESYRQKGYNLIAAEVFIARNAKSFL